MNLKERYEAMRRERDDRIVRMVEAGATHAEVAKVFGITRGRVGQILDERGRAKR